MSRLWRRSANKTLWIGEEGLPLAAESVPEVRQVGYKVSRLGVPLHAGRAGPATPTLDLLEGANAIKIVVRSPGVTQTMHLIMMDLV